MTGRPTTLRQRLTLGYTALVCAALAAMVLATGVLLNSDAAGGWPWGPLLLVAMGIALATSVGGIWLVRWLIRPLETLARESRQIASGESSRELPLDEANEVGELAKDLNQMAIELEERQARVLVLQREQFALLSTLQEGVIAIDRSGVIRLANAAAARFLDSEEEPLLGQSVAELRFSGLRRLVDRTLEGAVSDDRASVLRSSRVDHLEARASTIRDGYDRITGAILVLADRSRLRRLESLRRDFAAHVSHELKTPLTAIQGFADTLLRGALEEPETARHFVEVMAEQSARLTALLENLMELARIENEAEKGEIRKEWCNLLETLQASVDSLSEAEPPGAAPPITVECREDLTARVNPSLLQQAVRNLLDNARRYAGDDAQIRVSAREDDRQIHLVVEDDGIGMAPEDSQRVFERFYRVAKTRADHPEGGGLGLPIVKYIVLAHGGNIEVNSQVGHGTSFAIRIPRY